MEKKYGEVVIGMDQTGQALTIRFVRRARSETECVGSVAVSLADLRSMPALTAEARVGQAVLGLLNGLAGVDFGGRDYGREAREALTQADAVIQRRAEEGDAGAQNSLGMKCLEESLKLRDETLLDAAEGWFRKAADQAYGPAVDFLKSWPNVKKQYRNRIAGNG